MVTHFQLLGPALACGADSESVATTVSDLGPSWEPDEFKYIREKDGTIMKIPRPEMPQKDLGVHDDPSKLPATDTVASCPTSSDGASGNGMPLPGEALLRRRTKGPALVRPMTSTPLEPPSEPQKVSAPEVLTPVNPLEQLKMVVVWLSIQFFLFQCLCHRSYISCYFQHIYTQQFITKIHL